jgi:hypothetical protein
MATLPPTTPPSCHLSGRRSPTADGAIVKLGEHILLSVKIGEPIWARVNDERLCSPDAIDLDSLAEFERHGVSFARILVPTQQVAC